MTPDPSPLWPAALTAIDTTLGWTAAATLASWLVGGAVVPADTTGDEVTAADRWSKCSAIAAPPAPDAPAVATSSAAAVSTVAVRRRGAGAGGGAVGIGGTDSPSGDVSAVAGAVRSLFSVMSPLCPVTLVPTWGQPEKFL
jgi:hypothetical protein